MTADQGNVSDLVDASSESRHGAAEEACPS